MTSPVGKDADVVVDVAVDVAVDSSDDGDAGVFESERSTAEICAVGATDGVEERSERGRSLFD